MIEPENVAALAALCRDRDLLVLSDEIYASFVYDGAQHRSIASEPGMTERTVIADSCSKTWSMTGWRVGWAIAPPPLAAAINVVHQHLSVCAPAFAQAGAVAALREGGGHTDAMVREYGERRRDVLAGLGDLDTVRLGAPDGAFYAFPRLQIPGVTGEQAAIRLLEDAGVASSPAGSSARASRITSGSHMRSPRLSCPRACRACASSPPGPGSAPDHPPEHRPLL